jgi:ABC-type phosphate transport system substrate-binding protein
MKSIRGVRGWALVAVGLLGAGPTVDRAAAQISVVVSASANVEATKPQVLDMFLGARTTWPNGTKVQVVDQPDTDVGQSFYTTFLGQSVAQVRTQWTRLVLSGQALAPKKEAGSDGVKRAVSQTPGAIGYIPTAELDASVKEVLRIG